MPSDFLVDLVKAFEGLRLHAYRDAVGVWTIGYGHAGAVPGQTVTAEQADQLLRQDLARFEQGVLQITAGLRLVRDQVDALTSFAFNVGLGALERSTMLVKLRHGDPTAVDEFGRWVYGTVGGKKVQLLGLVRRRKAEAALYSSRYRELADVLRSMGQARLADRALALASDPSRREQVA